MGEKEPRELPTPQAGDFALMTQLAEDLGGNLNASNFIGNIYNFVKNTSMFEQLVDQSIRLQLFWRQRGELQPQYQEMDYEEYIQHVKHQAVITYSEEISIAEAELIVTLRDLKDRGLVNRALQVMYVMGLRQTEDGFKVVDKDEERSARIIQVAKIMDPEYRALVKGNPEWFKKRNPALYEMLEGSGTDDGLSSRYRELRDEL